MMNKQGILHKMMLLVILIAGFGLALTLPAYKRHQDRRHARQVVQVLRQLAEQERVFYREHGFYRADLATLDAGSCKPLTKGGSSGLHCVGYDVELEDARFLRARSIKYPQWFTLAVEKDTVHCEYEVASPVGEQLCAAAHLQK